MPAPEHVDVQVVDGLRPVRAVVDDHAVAVLEVLLCSHSPYHGEQVAKKLRKEGDA